MAELTKKLGEVNVRYDWYQTETHVTLHVLQKNIDAALLKLDFQPRSVTVNLPGIEEPFRLSLSHEINASGVVHKLSPFKLEVRMPKIDGIHWKDIEGEEVLTAKPIPKVDSSEAQESAATKAKKEPKNWDAVVKDEVVEEGDPLNDLFKKIYSEGSDEVRKAMNKSFMESGGTVLSTNWNEVGTDKVDIKPPEGVEFKKWD